MKNLIAWFADNHVAANLLMILIVVGGVVSFVRFFQVECGIRGRRTSRGLGDVSKRQSLLRVSLTDRRRM